MNNVSLGKKRLNQARPVLAALVLSVLCNPLSVLASTVLPSQVLPPATGKSCAAVTFSDITPHVYSGKLDSFDITISDPSYVAVLTTVADAAIEYHYITRWNNPDGSIKMHVDLPSTSTYADLPIQIVFLSTPSDTNGLPLTCIFNVEVTLRGTHHVSQSGQGNYVPPQLPVKQPSDDGQGTTTQPVSTTQGDKAPNVGLVAASHALGRLCVDGGASKLWVVLLMLYALFTFILCAQRREAVSAGSEWNIALILGVFLALLIFWYVSSVCRVGPWAPACATLIAVLGLVYAMFQDNEPQGILLLKDGTK